ncbi:hypothetical protein GCK32_016820 [Trichostrongylus colubriformis]|uniref:Uncharacterized protein n=1 Tax=Trichostrongylus colubriformis TaxID=6319 RepID=A0AAN8FPT4_TRICO
MLFQGTSSSQCLEACAKGSLHGRLHYKHAGSFELDGNAGTTRIYTIEDSCWEQTHSFIGHPILTAYVFTIVLLGLHNSGLISNRLLIPVRRSTSRIIHR